MPNVWDYLHCDAVQMIGKYPVDVQLLKVSFLTGTAHKFHGPKGSVFFMNNDNIIHPFIYGGSQERNMRAGTENVAGIAGLAQSHSGSLWNHGWKEIPYSKAKERFEENWYREVDDVIFNHAEGEACMYHISSVSLLLRQWQTCWCLISTSGALLLHPGVPAAWG